MNANFQAGDRVEILTGPYKGRRGWILSRSGIQFFHKRAATRTYQVWVESGEAFWLTGAEIRAWRVELTFDEGRPALNFDRTGLPAGVSEVNQ